MATLVLSVAGQAIGGAIGGPVGAVIGQTVGAIAGQYIDQAIFAPDGGTVERARLADLDVQASTEGAPMPRVYGRVRLSGQVIWATRFEEVVSDEKQGGKGGGGGATVRSYAYYGSFAVALCEGEVDHVARVWADGRLMDMEDVAWRFHRGGEDQVPDPLIEAVQGPAPAYRGTAYIVFERLALEAFGNRLPQISVEVIRCVDALEPMVRAVTLIPGAGEFVYAPDPVTAARGPGTGQPVNRHTGMAATDWQASLDELQALCPNLTSVSLVVSWFGDDLRCGTCDIRPAVEDRATATAPLVWQVAGETRATARLVGRIDDRPAFGGTPCDATVIAAIRDLKARGLEVMLAPFVLMDIPDANALPDPYTEDGAGTGQAAYPWRGRITCHPAPGQPGTADLTPTAAAQVAEFLGSAVPADYSVTNETVFYAGPAEWSWRRFILHCAHLAQAAGGVDAFLLGSELRGLTQLRDAAGGYPFVDGLVALAADVRAVLGPSTALSYAADWSEYAAHRPGGGEVMFNLDPLWSSPDIDFIGIDMYAPLADWRDGAHADLAEAAGINDPAYLATNIAGGEYFDWYYASDTDRAANLRSPISDGDYGEPWVHRVKDLAGWWTNPHHDRPGGVRSETPTGWVPKSLPIRFTELGCAAVDRGANQPNVFPDPKSTEHALPHFSNGARDDFHQRRVLETVLAHWSGPANPVSTLYGGPMVDPARLHLWTWDARPWPAFPLETGAWADGGNWAAGHWLNGRLGGTSLEGLLRALMADFGIPAGDVEISGIEGVLDGFAVPGPASLRQVVEGLARAFGFVAVDAGAVLRLAGPNAHAVAEIAVEDLAETGEGRALCAATRAQDAELPLELQLGHADALRDHAAATVASRRLAGASRRLTRIETQAVAQPGMMQAAADARLRDAWAGRTRHAFALGPAHLGLEPGDLIRLSAPGEAPRLVRLDSIEDSAWRAIEAHGADPTELRNAPAPALSGRRAALPARAAAPAVAIADLPMLTAEDPGAALHVAAFARPWSGGMTVWRSLTGASYAPVAEIPLPATLGELADPISPGPEGLWDRANAPRVTLYGGALAARAEADVLAGANLAALRSSSGGWEVIQFCDAELTGERSWRISRLLRGQGGTEDSMRAGAAAGAPFMLLDARLLRLDPGLDALGTPLHLRIVPRGRPSDDTTAVEIDITSGARNLVPFSPVHPRAVRLAPDGDIALRWIRRTRHGGDSWALAEVPLNEAAEAWEIDILPNPPAGGATPLRTLASATASAIYTVAEQAEDFGGPARDFTVAIHQLSATLGRGTPRRARIRV